MGGSNPTYIQETTSETKFDEARRLVLSTFNDLRLRVGDNKPAKELQFHDKYEIWSAQKELEAAVLAKGKIPGTCVSLKSQTRTVTGSFLANT